MIDGGTKPYTCKKYGKVSFWLLGEGQAFFVGSVATCKLPVFNKPN